MPTLDWPPLVHGTTLQWMGASVSTQGNTVNSLCANQYQQLLHFLIANQIGTSLLMGEAKCHRL